MKNLLKYIILFLPIILLAQNTDENKNTYKKRVLENSEVDILTSFYTQDGSNAAVTGGIGSENLQDIAANITISVPLNADDVFSFDGTISDYTSASSSNLNPFFKAGSRNNGGNGGDDDDRAQPLDTRTWAAKTGASSGGGNSSGPTIGTPWSASSGASKTDVWGSGTLGYSHSSDSRNSIYNTHLSFSKEFDYTSFGLGAGFTKLFNQKNTEIGIKGNVYFDKWNPQYPTEIKTYIITGGNLNADFFNGVDILDHNGNPTVKTGINTWHPKNNTFIDKKGRNTYSVSLSFSQILSKNLQVSIFSDIVMQKGWLANPMQRVYFADKPNYYIGRASDIPNYTNNKNQGVFQLADDYEHLPDNRLKIPVGIRLHYYINEFLVFKTYYRYYSDDWNINSHTLNFELPIKLSRKYTLYPNYRFYNQTAAKYFAPYEQLLSTSTYYTSDFDLSEYNANQFGIGLKYTDVFTKKKVWKFGFKNWSLNYNYYKRNTGFHAHIISFGTKFVLDK